MADDIRNGPEMLDMFDVRSSFQTIATAIRNHKLLIAGSCLLTLGLITLYIVLWPPVYKGEAELVADKETDSARDAFYVDWNVFRKDDAQSEVEMMKAGNVLKQVIDKENLRYDDVYHPFFSHLTYLWEKTPVAKFYKDVKLKIFPEPFNPYKPTPEQVDFARTLMDLRSGISLEPVGETNVGKLTIRGPSPRVSRVANSLIDIYLTDRIERHQAEANRAYEVLNGAVERARKRLDGIAQARLDFAQAHGVVNFDFQKETVEVGKLAELEVELAAGRKKIATLQASITAIDNELQNQPAVHTSLTVTDVNPLREAAKQKRLELEIALTQDTGRFRDDSPEIQERRAEIAKLTQIIEGQGERVEKSASQSINELHQDLLSKKLAMAAELEGARAGQMANEETSKNLQARLSTLPGMQTQMRVLDQQYALAQQEVNALSIKSAEARVSSTTVGGVTPSVRVVEYANPPSTKSWPSLKMLYPAALAVGLLLGIGMAVIRTCTGGKVNRDYIRKLEAEAPLYGRVRITMSSGGLAVKPRARTAAAGSSLKDN